jgi:hypothetical protein
MQMLEEASQESGLVATPASGRRANHARRAATTTGTDRRSEMEMS